MPTRTIYIDVDQTLIGVDSNLLPGVRDKLEYLWRYGYELICWSGGGKEYAQKICDKNNITQYFRMFLDKPDIIVDDNPDSIMGHARVCKVDSEDWWVNHFPNMMYKKEVF